MTTVAPTNLVDELDRFSKAASWQEIGDHTDPIFRNYLITHNYWRLAGDMAALLGRDNLVWPGFGAWASAQAGEFMRLEGLDWVELVPAFGERITELLGRGNRLIFLDIAPVFARFVELMATDDSAKKAEHRRLAHTAVGEVPAYIQDALGLDPRPVDEAPDGQQAMIWAFSEYFLAAHTSCEDARAERIYVANCFVGLQEQSRIDCMLDALLGVEDINRIWLLLAAPLVRLWGAGDALWGGFCHQVGRPRTSRARHLYRLARTCVVDGKLSQVLGTQLLMTMQVGDEELDIGEDVPGLSKTAAYPRHLASFEEPSPEFRARLEALLAWDRTLDTPEGSAAVDWSELGDRMNYIVDLFRTRQQDRRLHAHPLETA